MSLLLASFVQPVRADEPERISDFRECRAISADARRLLCYDTIADGGVYGEEHLEQVQRENFGSKDEDPELATDRLSVTIVRVESGANRVRYFHTADGAIWKQTGRGGWNLDVPFQAELKEGLLGSYFLVTEGGKSTRVKRVK